MIGGRSSPRRPRAPETCRRSSTAAGRAGRAVSGAPREDRRSRARRRFADRDRRPPAGGGSRGRSSGRAPSSAEASASIEIGVPRHETLDFGFSTAPLTCAPIRAAAQTSSVTAISQSRRRAGHPQPCAVAALTSADPLMSPRIEQRSPTRRASQRRRDRGSSEISSVACAQQPAARVAQETRARSRNASSSSSRSGSSSCDPAVSMRVLDRRGILDRRGEQRLGRRREGLLGAPPRATKARSLVTSSMNSIPVARSSLHVPDGHEVRDAIRESGTAPVRRARPRRRPCRRSPPPRRVRGASLAARGCPRAAMRSWSSRPPHEPAGLASAHGASAAVGACSRSSLRRPGRPARTYEPVSMLPPMITGWPVSR